MLVICVDVRTVKEISVGSPIRIVVVRRHWYKAHSMSEVRKRVGRAARNQGVSQYAIRFIRVERV